jgi:hypothetical protein
VAAAVSFIPLGSPLVGQTVGTLETGVSVVEYDGFLVSGAAVLSPALRYDKPDFSLGTQGSWVIFESGNEILQGSAAAAWLTPLRNGWQAEFSGSVGVAKYADQAVYGHVLGRTRLHFRGEQTGAWVSGATGQSFGDSNATPVEVAVGGWRTVRNDLALAGTVTGSWLPGDGYLDVIGVVRWTGTNVQLDAQAGVRPWTQRNGGDAELGDPVRGAYAELSALITLSQRITVALSAGRYPSDPVRGVLAANYANVGLRLNLFGSPVITVPTITAAMVRAAGELAASEHASQAVLEVATSRTASTFRVHVPGESVEIMGDFTDWQPAALSRTGAETWEIQLPVGSGVHRLNVRVDGGRWLVPRGTRLEQTEFGAAAGVVVIP